MQHHWRGVVFERGLLLKKDYDPGVCARLRAMHLVKHLELRHQFKVLREAIGANGLPTSVVESYVTVLYHLTRSSKDPLSSSLSEGQGDTKTSSMRLADQKKLVGSGALVYLASLITKSQKREVTEMVKAIMLDIAESQGDEKIVDLLICNVVQRVTLEIERLVLRDKVTSSHPSLMSSVNLLGVLSDAVLSAKRTFGNASLSKTKTVGIAFAKKPDDTSGSEHVYLLKKLETSAKTYLITPFVIQILFSALQYDLTNTNLCIKVLNTLRSLAGSFGFPQILEALTRNGGRHFESVTFLFGHQDPSVVAAAVSLFYDLSSRPDARKGLTTAGATQIFLGWTGSGAIEASKAPMLHVLGLIGVGLLARQTHHAASSSGLLSSLQTLSDRLDALYSILLDLVSDTVHNIEKTASYLLTTHALPSLLQFLTQVKPSCMDSPFQTPKQRSISCIMIGRILKLPAVAQFCFSENLVNHLALSLQCSRLDEIEHLVASMTAQERFIHTLGAKEVCKALSRLSRCPSTSVDAKLKPSITSANVPELPQALICDVMFRLHVLEDLIASIKSPSDGAEFAELELVLAAVELGGYLRPLPFGDAARTKFFKVSSNSVSHIAQTRYMSEKLLALVELVAPAILHVLREKSACYELVSTCCAALSRLACTNAACSLLLTQGCLQLALIHLPEILFAAPTSQENRHHHHQQTYAQDSNVDDHGLLDVPASLYTLVGKLCAVAEGRTAVMRAQVLPRLLKRLQLRQTTDCKRSLDDDCKSEIAVVIQQLAMVNAVEGNTSELFLHFHVLELMLQLAQEQDIPSILHGKGHHNDHSKWRLLDHALGAIAALSQDVLVCVPRVAEMGVLKLVLPFILRERKDEAAMRAESLQYHAVSIIRSVAAYPFGKYHALLHSIEDKKRAAGSSAIGLTGSMPSSLLERVKKVAYNFALELENRPTSSLDQKTVGELARETLTFIQECSDRANAAVKPGNHVTAAAVKCDPRRASGGRLGTPSKTSQRKQEARKDSSFPALPGSPITHQRKESKCPTLAAEPALETTNNRNSASALSPRLQLASVRSTSLLPSRSPKRTQSPTPQKSASHATLMPPSGDSLNSNSTLSGVDLMLTRPPGSKPQSEDEKTATQHLNQGSRTNSSGPTPYTFALPKKKKTRKKSDMASCNLMLDPLFQSSAGFGDLQYGHRSHKKPGRTSSYLDDDNGREATSYVFVQEIDRFGHCVSVKARRATSGDKYVRSLGHVAMSNGGVQQLNLE